MYSKRRALNTWITLIGQRKIASRGAFQRPPFYSRNAHTRDSCILVSSALRSPTSVNPVRHRSSREIGMRAAVVGAGPAGIYAAQSLLKRFPTCIVDIIERLPVPFGLVRYGVSPDHPATKNVINLFSTFIRSNRDRINFFGNVPVGDGHLITSKRIEQLYDISVYATGAERPRGLTDISIPSQFVYGAQDFAFWANGHPYVCDPSIPNYLSSPLERDLKSANDVAVVGIGNVAIDVARILLRPVADLYHTDVSQSALELLSQSSIKSVTLFGRKSPLDAAWTTSALREIVTKIPSIVTSCDHSLVQADLDTPSLSRTKKSMLKILKQNTIDSKSAELHRYEISGSKILRLEFLKSVASFGINEGDSVRMRLKQNQTKQNQDGSEDHSLIEMDQVFGVVFLSLGYVGGQGPGLRVGWANGNASGIIGDNKWDAETVISTLPRSVLRHSKSPGISGLLDSEGVNYVTWEGWEHIDTVEQQRAERCGRKHGRVKLETIQEMLQVANQNAQEMLESR